MAKAEMVVDIGVHVHMVKKNKYTELILDCLIVLAISPLLLIAFVWGAVEGIYKGLKKLKNRC